MDRRDLRPRVTCASLWFMNTGHLNHEGDDTMVPRAHGQRGVDTLWIFGDAESWCGIEFLSIVGQALVPNMSSSLSKSARMGREFRTNCSHWGIGTSGYMCTASNPWWWGPATREEYLNANLHCRRMPVKLGLKHTPCPSLFSISKHKKKTSGTHEKSFI